VHSPDPKEKIDYFPETSGEPLEEGNIFSPFSLLKGSFVPLDSVGEIFRPEIQIRCAPFFSVHFMAAFVADLRSFSSRSLWFFFAVSDYLLYLT